MEPYPAPNSVIVMDNCQIHKHPQIQRMIEERFVITCGSRLWLMNRSSEVCVASFYPHIPQISIPSSSHFRSWSIRCVAMVIMYACPWQRCLTWTFSFVSSNHYIP
jgi:hypothetical protein